LLVLAIGIRLGTGPWRQVVARESQKIALSVGIYKWFSWYLLAFFVAEVALVMIRFVPPLSQPLLALAYLKWAFFFMLTYASFLRPVVKRNYWVIAFLLEFLLSIGGFFSDFKTVFFFTFMGVMAAGVRFTPDKVVTLSIFGVIIFILAIYWTAIKFEYRDYASGGSMAQVIEVDLQDRYNKLAQLIAEQDAESLDRALDDFLRRLSYVDFFGMVLQYVPESEPHANGAIWLDAIQRPFMPRAFFPDKEVIDDSSRTTQYTGYFIIGGGSTTSVSIGYIGESYIDFGARGMFVPIFIFGFLIGRTYRWLVLRAITKGLLGMGLASAIIITLTYLDSSITKIMGGYIASLLVVWLFNKMIVPGYLRWCLAGRSQGPLRNHYRLDTKPELERSFRISNQASL